MTEMQAEQPLLAIEALTIRFDTPDGPIYAVNRLSLNLEAGEVLGIVGESGSGKSQTWLAPLGLLADNAEVEGAIHFDGQDLTQLDAPALNRIRGKKIAMVFQDPMTSLNPYVKIGVQMMEAIRVHQPAMTRQDAKARCIDLLTQVRLSDPEARLTQYPHTLSGGMRQRVMIAMALLNEPDILIADEPTTALDVTIQAEILDILRDLQQRLGTAVVFITHDLGVIANLCDRVAVIYAGQVVEVGSAEQVLSQPQHPYTLSLLRATPRFEPMERQAADAAAPKALFSIPGLPPNLRQRASGCAFAPRCFCVRDNCWQSAPPERAAAPEHRYRCTREEDSAALNALFDRSSHHDPAV